MIVIGSSGQLATSFRHLFEKEGVTAEFISRKELDLGDPKRVHSILDERLRLLESMDSLHSRVLINTAAYTAVDTAESDRDAAYLANTASPHELALWAEKNGFLFVHYSTDYVFDGSGTNPRKESDATGPLSVYGASKLAGEMAIATDTRNFLIFRTSWLYAHGGKNFPLTILRVAQIRPELTVVDDQWGAPTWTDDLAEYSWSAIQQTLANPKLAGLYHLSNSGATTWKGFAERLLELYREKLERSGAVVPALAVVKAVPSESYPTSAARPRNSRLDLTRFTETFGVVPRGWKDALREWVAKL